MTDQLLRRIFLLLNKYFMVPVFRLGLGAWLVNPFSGYILVLKTTGRRSGLIRYAPVNYAIHNGAIYCLSGWGEQGHWYRNLLAQPHVELLLPDRSMQALAEVVADPDEKLTVTRQILINGGFAGFFLGFNPRRVSDLDLAAQTADFPVIRLRPQGAAAGANDPGGWGWLFYNGIWIALLIFWFRRPGRRSE